MTDTERLNAIEKYVNDNGALLVHTGDIDTKGHPGLGLRPGSVRRTLREAIDQALLGAVKLKSAASRQ